MPVFTVWQDGEDHHRSGIVPRVVGKLFQNITDDETGLVFDQYNFEMKEFVEVSKIFDILLKLNKLIKALLDLLQFQ